MVPVLHAGTPHRVSLRGFERSQAGPGRGAINKVSSSLASSTEEESAFAITSTISTKHLAPVLPFILPHNRRRG